MTNVQGDQAPQKQLKMWEKFESSSTKTVAEQSMSSQTPLGSVNGVCQEILTENLNMHHIAAKFVPPLLISDQKQRCINVCLELREKANKDPTFISRIIMGDISWIYGYDPETK
jgi:hypothetical protein